MGLTGNGAIDFHDAIAADFAHRYESSAAFLERFRVWTGLFNRYIKPTDHVLDLGCGSGIFSHYLADRVHQVTGIDGSPAMIELCQRKTPANNVHYVLETLPFTDLGCYEVQDVIIMSSLLEYLDDMPIVLEQVQQLLRPNGLFIVSLPNQLSIYRRIERLIFRLIRHPRYVAHICNTSSETAFSDQLTDLGLDVVETVYFSSADPVSRFLRSFLSNKYVNNLFVSVCRKRV